MFDRIARISLVILLVGGATEASRAQDDKPTAQQIAAVRACADKNQNDVTEAERQCLFNLVATPCQSTPEGQSNLGMADCFRLEAMIWDVLLNENYKRLRNDLDETQIAGLRDMACLDRVSRQHVRLLRHQDPGDDGHSVGRGVRGPRDGAAGFIA
jgi:hypothetical protein